MCRILYSWLTIILIGISSGLGVEVAYIIGDGDPYPISNANISTYNLSDNIDFSTGGGNAAICGSGDKNISEVQKSFNIRIKPNDEDIRFNGVELAKSAPGIHNIGQICSIYDFLAKNWRYVPDPTCIELYQNATESLKHGIVVRQVLKDDMERLVRGGVGDCDDFAILMASHIESIGGTCRIMLASGPKTGHAYAEAYLGNMSENKNEIDHIANFLKLKYHAKGIATHYNMSTGDVWLNLDWGESPNEPTGTPGCTFYEAYKQIPIYIREGLPKTVVSPWPIVLFTYRSASGDLKTGEPITFNATQCESFDSIKSYEWDFGDTKKGVGAVVNHIYNNSVNASVTLDVTDKNNNHNRSSVQIKIKGKNISHRPEIMLFAADKDNINLGDSVSLKWITSNATSVTLEPGMGRVNLNGTISISPINTTTYILKASSSEYLAEGSISVFVNDYIPPEPPIPIISIDKSDPRVGDPMTFTGSKSNDDKSGNIIYYEWNFGDGSIGEGESIEHVFSQSGIYEITLTAAYDNGLKGFNTTSLAINPPENDVVAQNYPVIASFSCDPGDPIAGQEIAFDASSCQGDIVKYQWNFDDGSPTVEGMRVIHLYSFEGANPIAYDVILTVTDATGSKHPVSKVVVVSPSISPAPHPTHIQLKNFGIVMGKVYNKNSYKGVASAEITYRTQPDGEEIRTGVMTDSNGNYQLELPPGKYYVAAIASGYGIPQRSVIVNRSQTTEQDLAAVKEIRL